MKSKGQTLCDGRMQANYKLSPNEEARLIRDETEKRRKLRLLQVRELSKVNAAKVRQDVKKERNRQLQKLATQIENQLEKEKDEKMQQLEAQYENSLRSIGQGHKEAGDQDDHAESRYLLMKEDNHRASLRQKVAIRRMKTEQAERQEGESRTILARKTALEVERGRALRIAALPPVPPDPLRQMDLPVKGKSVKMTDTEAFSSTHYHIMNDYAVERATPEEQTDAHQAAEDEQDRLNDAAQTVQLAKHGQMEKARLRHKHARSKELLKQDYNKILLDLSDLQRADMFRRQKIVQHIPKQVFQPPHKRLEDKEEDQRFMEESFEDMYLAKINFGADLSLALDPHPPPDSPAATESLDLSVLSAPPTPDKKETGQSQALKDVTNLVVQDGGAGKEKKPETVLQKLMNKIKVQRQDFSARSGDLSATEDATKVNGFDVQKPKSGTATSDRTKHVTMLMGSNGSEPGIAYQSTLMHPMEIAERLRQKPQEHSTRQENAPFVTDGQHQSGVSNDLLQAAIAQNKLIEEQKRKLEEKLRNMDNTRVDPKIHPANKMPVGSSQPLSSKPAHAVRPPVPLQQGSYRLAGPQSIVPAYQMPIPVYPQSSYFPPTAKPPTEGLVTSSTGPPSTSQIQPFSNVHHSADSSVQMMSKPLNLSTSLQGANGGATSPQNKQAEHIKKIKEYQQRLLQRHEESKKILADARAGIEKKHSELMNRVSEEPSSHDTGLMSVNQVYSASKGILIGPSNIIANKETINLPESHMVHQDVNKHWQANLDKPAENFNLQSNKMDGIRKSLSFDEDLDPTKRGVPFSDLESSLTSTNVSYVEESSSDRGSPALPITKKNLSPPTESNLDPNSNEALVRRHLFELRQEDLRQQMLEIQRQKEDLLQKQYLSQLSQREQQMQLISKSGLFQDPSKISSIEERPTQDTEEANTLKTWAERLRQGSTGSDEIKPPITNPSGLSQYHNLHDLSTIQEVDTPLSTQVSSTYKPGRSSLSSDGSYRFENGMQHKMAPETRLGTCIEEYPSKLQHHKVSLDIPSSTQKQSNDIMTSLPDQDHISIIQPTQLRESSDLLSKLPSYARGVGQGLVSFPELYRPFAPAQQEVDSGDVTWRSVLSDNKTTASLTALTPEPLSEDLLDDSSIYQPSTEGINVSHDMREINKQHPPTKTPKSSVAPLYTNNGASKPTWTMELSSANGTLHPLSPDSSESFSLNSGRATDAKYVADLDQTAELTQYPLSNSELLNGVDLTQYPLTVSGGIGKIESDSAKHSRYPIESVESLRVESGSDVQNLSSSQTHFLTQYPNSSTESYGSGNQLTQYPNSSTENISPRLSENQLTQYPISSNNTSRNDSPKVSESHLTQYPASSAENGSPVSTGELSQHPNSTSDLLNGDNLQQKSKYSSPEYYNLPDKDHYDPYRLVLGLENMDSKERFTATQKPSMVVPKRDDSGSLSASLTQHSIMASDIVDDSDHIPKGSESDPTNLLSINDVSNGAPRYSMPISEDSHPITSSKLSTDETHAEFGSIGMSPLYPDQSEVSWQIAGNLSMNDNRLCQKVPENELGSQSRSGSYLGLIDSDRQSSINPGDSKLAWYQPGVTGKTDPKISTFSSNKIADNSLTQYSVMTDKHQPEKSLSQYMSALLSDTSLTQHEASKGPDESLTQYSMPTFGSGPSRSRYKSFMAADELLTQYNAEPDSSLTQYSIDPRQEDSRGQFKPLPGNVSSFSKQNYADSLREDVTLSQHTTSMSHPENVLSQCSLSTDEDDKNSLTEKLSHYEQLIKQSRDLIERHKDLERKVENMSIGESTRDQLQFDDSTGILEEPNLTLVTLASETSVLNETADGVLDLTDSQPQESVSLMSFEQHELSMGNTPGPNSGVKRNNGVLIFDATDHPAPVLEPQANLQDAFLKRKKDFIAASEQRAKAAKEKTSDPQTNIEEKTSEPQTNAGLTKTLASWKKSRTMKPSGPAKKENRGLNEVTKTAPDRKQDTKEMVDRTKKLYNKLEEVQQKNELDERNKKYAANREKAKKYHKKLQEKRKKNVQGKK